MDACLFCKIVAKQVPAEILYEDENTMAFLDIYPVSKGHTVVIPKTHAVNLGEGSQEDAVALMKTIHALAPRIVGALGATAYNLGMNHGVDAGQEIMHTHLHIMPRYAGDSRSFAKTRPSKEELQEVAQLIRS